MSWISRSPPISVANDVARSCRSREIESANPESTGLSGSGLSWNLRKYFGCVECAAWAGS